MLEKILKIVKTIDSCKFLHQLEPCLLMIGTFERDSKPRDERIIEGLLRHYRIKENEIIETSKKKRKLLKNNFKAI